MRGASARKQVRSAGSTTPGSQPQTSDRKLAWFQAIATGVAAIALLVQVISTRVQYSQFQAELASRKQDQADAAARDARIFASRVSTWSASLGMNLAPKDTRFEVVVQNGSPVALTRVGLELTTTPRQANDHPFYMVMVGVLPPCTRITLKLLPVGEEAKIPTATAIFFDDPRGSWRLDSHARLEQFPAPTPEQQSVDTTVVGSEPVAGCSTSI